MGMTIDDNIDFLNEAKKLFEDIANNPSINETIKTYFIIDSLESAIVIMRKYKNIEQILDDCDLEAWEVLEKVKEEVEDGNDD